MGFVTRQTSPKTRQTGFQTRQQGYETRQTSPETCQTGFPVLTFDRKPVLYKYW